MTRPSRWPVRVAWMLIALNAAVGIALWWQLPELALKWGDDVPRRSAPVGTHRDPARTS